MTARCDLTDLDVDSCDHCRAAARRVITAGLSSTCPTCSGPIEPGDRIRETALGSWEHAAHR